MTRVRSARVSGIFSKAGSADDRVECKVHIPVEGGAFVPPFIVTSVACKTGLVDGVEVGVPIGSEASACGVEAAELGGTALGFDFSA